MDFKSLYEQKKCSPQEIAALVEDRWRIGMDTAVSQAPTILEALAERAANDEIYGVRVQSLLDVQSTSHLLDPSLYKRIIRESWFSGSGSRQEVNHGMADVIPNYYRDIPRHIRRQYEYDVYCATVSPMDKHGYFSLGTVSSYSGAMMEKSRRIFLEVNDQTLQEGFILERSWLCRIHSHLQAASLHFLVFGKRTAEKGTFPAVPFAFTLSDDSEFLRD